MDSLQHALMFTVASAGGRSDGNTHTAVCCRGPLNCDVVGGGGRGAAETQLISAAPRHACCMREPRSLRPFSAAAAALPLFRKHCEEIREDSRPLSLSLPPRASSPRHLPSLILCLAHSPHSEPEVTLSLERTTQPIIGLTVIGHTCAPCAVAAPAISSSSLPRSNHPSIDPAHSWLVLLQNT